MEEILKHAGGKVGEAVYKYAESQFEKLHVEHVVDLATEQDVKGFLLKKYADTVFYHDLDSYFTQNKIVPHLISSLRGENKLQANNKDDFVESNVKHFLELFPKHKFKLGIRRQIKNAFGEAFDLTFSKTIAVNPYSDAGKLLAAMSSFESSRKRDTAEVLSGVSDVSENVHRIMSILTSPTSVLMMQTLGSAGMEVDCDFAEEISTLAAEMIAVETDLQKKCRFKEAIEAYQALEHKILMQLRMFPSHQADKLLCSLFSDLALCYANIGSMDRAKDYLASAPKEAAGEDKTFQFICAAIQTFYDQSQDFDAAQMHVDKALSLDPAYHNAFLLKQLLNAKQKIKSTDEIIAETDAHFLSIVQEDARRELISEYYLHKGLIFMEEDRLDEALPCFESACEHGYDPDVVHYNIAIIYYAKGVSAVPKNKKTILPEYDCAALLKALDYIRPLILFEKKSKFHPLAKNHALQLYASVCTMLGMPLDLEAPESYLDDPEVGGEVKRAIILGAATPMPEKYTELLDDEDRQFLKAKSFIQANDPEGLIKYIEALLTVNGSVSAALYNLLLQNCLIRKSSAEYWMRREQAAAAGVSERLLRAYDAAGYELENKLDLALEQYQIIAHDESEYEILERAASFFTRYDHVEEALALFDKILELRKNNAIYIYDSDSFYSNTVFYLLSHDPAKARDVIEALDPATVSPLVLHHLSFAVSAKFSDWHNMLYACEKAYELSSNFPDGFRLALCLQIFQRYAEALAVCRDLLRIAADTDEKVKCLWLASDLCLYLSDAEKSFEYAREAHLLTKTNPYDKSHPAFFNRALRTGHGEALPELLAFKAEHPVVADWIQEISMPMGEPDGSKIADQISMTVSGRTTAENKRRGAEKTTLYQKGILPLHSLFISFGSSISMLLAFGSKHKLLIADGDIRKSEKEMQSISDSVVVDAYSLIILELSDCLSLLNEVPHVHVPFQLINKLQLLYLSLPDSTEHLENILSWLRSSDNVCLEPDGLPWDGSKLSQIFSEDFIPCCNIARQLQVPYLTCEAVAGRIQLAEGCEYSDINLISIPSLCSKVFENSLEQRASMRYNLLKYCTFISFSAPDLVNIIKADGCVITAEFAARFMIFNSSCDVASFSNVYLQAIALLFKQNETTAEEFVKLVLSNALRVWRRGANARYCAERFQQEEWRRQAKTIQAYAVQVYYGIEFIYQQLGRELSDELASLHRELFQCAVAALTVSAVQEMLQPIRIPENLQA